MGSNLAACGRPGETIERNQGRGYKTRGAAGDRQDMMKTQTVLLRRRARLAVAADTISIATTFDAVGARRFARSIARLIGRHPSFAIVDMSKTTSVDSSGFGSLISGLKKLDEAGTTPYVVCTEPSVRKLMDFTGVSRMFTVVDHMDEARRAHEEATAAALAS